ncbi:MAG: non-ribosomal peptide synthetase, partial [Opitutaceae bacterium]
DEMPADARTFLEACGKLGITVLDLPTAYWHSLTREMAAERLPLPESIRLVIIGGERALPECLRLWRQAVGDSIPLINGYGPTEATVVVTFAELSTTDAASTDRDVPIGRPLANTRIHLLDAHRQPVPVGVKGELCIGGVQVARGYHRRPELTAEKFIADPFSPPGSGERLYRTGDLARYRPDGTIEFLGRIDHQVKIRGFRVEPGEIEAAFARHPQIKETVVTAREQSPGEHQLIAYFAPLAGCAPETAALRRHLAASLPDYMIPAAFVSVERLPLNTSGKVDLRALQKIARTESANNLRAFSAPRTETEQRLAHVWREVLGLDRVSIHDDFFELGGHSLVAMRMVSRLRREFEIELPLRSLFEAHTVARQAGIIEELQTLRRPARPAPVDVSFEEELI